MTSSSAESGAAGALPPPDRLAAFYKLVDKYVIAALLCRYARAVDLAAQAATQAEALFPDDSLVVARLRMAGSENLNNISCRASGAEREAFARQSWELLLSVIPVLLRRLGSNTLLPGTIREEELDYAVHTKAVACTALNKPLPLPAALRARQSTMGYGTLLTVMARGLDLLSFPWWPAEQKRSVESFVLRGLDVIPRTAGIQAGVIAGEEQLVATVEIVIAPLPYNPVFCAAVLCKWRSEAVSSVLRARGVLQTGIAKCEQSSADFKADVAKHGCATVPSPPVPRRRRRSRSLRGAPAVAPWCTVAWSTRRWTGGRTKRRAAKRKQHGWLKMRRRKIQTAGQADEDERKTLPQGPAGSMLELTD